MVHWLIKRVISSAVEQLVYTEKVGGSNPSSPTILIFFSILFCFFLNGCGRKSDLISPDNAVDHIEKAKVILEQVYPPIDLSKELEKFRRR